jgi:hypothetical protein
MVSKLKEHAENNKTPSSKLTTPKKGLVFRSWYGINPAAREDPAAGLEFFSETLVLISLLICSIVSDY